jgi:hypothetical protein
VVLNTSFNENGPGRSSASFFNRYFYLGSFVLERFFLSLPRLQPRLGSKA